VKKKTKGETIDATHGRRWTERKRRERGRVKEEENAAAGVRFFY
jgi:hypothetical protein